MKYFYLIFLIKVYTIVSNTRNAWIKKEGNIMDTREKLIELRKQMGMRRTEFCSYFEIPYRTVEDWETGKRKMPDYLLRLMYYKARVEQLLKENEQS